MTQKRPSEEGQRVDYDEEQLDFWKISSVKEYLAENLFPKICIKKCCVCLIPSRTQKIFRIGRERFRQEVNFVNFLQKFRL